MEKDIRNSRIVDQEVHIVSAREYHKIMKEYAACSEKKGKGSEL